MGFRGAKRLVNCYYLHRWIKNFEKRGRADVAGTTEVPATPSQLPAPIPFPLIYTMAIMAWTVWAELEDTLVSPLAHSSGHLGTSWNLGSRKWAQTMVEDGDRHGKDGKRCSWRSWAGRDTWRTGQDAGTGSGGTFLPPPPLMSLAHLGMRGALELFLSHSSQRLWGATAQGAETIGFLLPAPASCPTPPPRVSPIGLGALAAPCPHLCAPLPIPAMVWAHFLLPEFCRAPRCSELWGSGATSMPSEEFTALQSRRGCNHITLPPWIFPCPSCSVKLGRPHNE